MFGMVCIDSILNLISIMFDKSLNRPSSGITQGTDGVAFDLFGEFMQHINLGVVGIAIFHSLQNVVEPSCSFPARSALPTAFMLIELRESKDGLDHICLVIHNDNCCRTQSAFKLPQRIKIHQDIFAEGLREKADTGPSWDDGFEVVPSPNDSSAMSVDEFFQGDGHFLFNGAGVVHMS